MIEKGVITIYKDFDRYIQNTAVLNRVSYSKAKGIVDNVLNSAATDIINGKTVTIPKLGSFAVKGVKERRIKDINTGEYRIIPAKNKIRYNPNKWILTQVN